MDFICRFMPGGEGHMGCLVCRLSEFNILNQGVSFLALVVCGVCFFFIIGF